MRNNKKLFFIIAAILTAAIIGAGFYVWDAYYRKIDFVIAGVPAITVFNHTGDNGYITSDAAAALVPVMEYYGAKLAPEDLLKINDALQKPSSPTGLNSIANYAKELGYDAKSENLPSIEALKKYINPSAKTPVIFSHFLEISQSPLIDFTPAGIVIGILEKEKMVVVHDYYFGYNKKIPYDIFLKLRGNTSWALIVRPKNNSQPQPSVNGTYSQQNPAMEKAEFLINKITLARAASKLRLPELNFAYIKNVVDYPDFEEYVPPYYKVVAYTAVANGYLRVDKNYEKAMEFVKEANDLNHDLDKPFGDFWPGFEDQTNKVINRFSGSYFALGEIYRGQKQYTKAIKAYEEAIAIWPDDPSRIVLGNLIKVMTAGRNK